MKTIVMYTDFSYGKQNPTGGTKRYLELIYGLVEKGNIVHLFVPKDAELKNHNCLVRHDIKRCAVNSFLIPNGLLNFLVNFKNLSYIKRINYDAIVSFDIPNSIQLRLLGIKRLLLFIRQDFIECRKISVKTHSLISKIYLSVLKIIEKTVILHAHKIIVQCQHDKVVLLKRHFKFEQIIQKKIFILNNNVNPSWVTSEKYCFIKKEKNENIQLCFIGDLNDPRKGFDILLSAVLILLDEGKNLSLNVIGGGTLLDNYRIQFASKANIKFWGMLEYPLTVINNCDLMVAPSLTDSFPNTILEAFYLELAVIGSNVGGIPEMLKYEELIFQPNVCDLVNKLRDALQYEKLELYRGCSRKRKNDLTFDWVEKVDSLI
jgi:glycosyltransferase involved in cell wall biosynthesis